MMTESPAMTAALRYAHTGNLSALDGFNKWALEDELIRHAKENARSDEDLGAALVRLSREDDVAKSIARAAHAAEHRMQRELDSDEQVAALAKHAGTATADQRPAHGSRDHIYKLMEEFARGRQRPDETFEAAFSRLMTEDEVFSKAYDAYCEAER